MLSLFDEIHQILAIAAVLTAIVAGLTVGTRPYRLAAGVMMVETFGWLAFSWMLDNTDKVLFSHGKSLVIAALLAAIVFYHRSLGLVVLLALQFVAVFIHLSVWLERSIPADINALVLNGVGWLMVVTLFVGSVGSFRGRRLETAAGSEAASPVLNSQRSTRDPCRADAGAGLTSSQNEGRFIQPRSK